MLRNWHSLTSVRRFEKKHTWNVAFHTRKTSKLRLLWHLNWATDGSIHSFFRLRLGVFIIIILFFYLTYITNTYIHWTTFTLLLNFSLCLARYCDIDCKMLEYWMHSIKYSPLNVGDILTGMRMVYLYLCQWNN